MALCRPTGPVAPLHQEILGLVSVFCLLSHQHPHAMIAVSDGVKSLIDEALRGYPDRRMVLRAYHLEAALAIIDTMPLVITVPADLAYLAADRHQLVIKPLLFDFKPFDYSMIWHPRCEHSAAQIWLRHLVKEECGRLITKRIHEMGFI